jgi:hypothetical protein
MLSNCSIVSINLSHEVCRIEVTKVIPILQTITTEDFSTMTNCVNSNHLSSTTHMLNIDIIEIKTIIKEGTVINSGLRLRGSVNYESTSIRLP